MLEPLPEIAVKQIVDPRTRNGLADCRERHKSRDVDGRAKTLGFRRKLEGVSASFLAEGPFLKKVWRF